MEDEEWLCREAVELCMEQDWQYDQSWPSSIFRWAQQDRPNPHWQRTCSSKRKSYAIFSFAIDVRYGQIWQPITQTDEQHRPVDELNQMVESKSKIIEFDTHATIQTNTYSKSEEKSPYEQDQWIKELSRCKKQITQLEHKEKNERSLFTKWHRIHEDFESTINRKRFIVHNKCEIEWSESELFGVIAWPRRTIIHVYWNSVWRYSTFEIKYVQNRVKEYGEVAAWKRWYWCDWRGEEK